MNKIRAQHISEAKGLFKEFSSRVVESLAKSLDANAADFTFTFENIIQLTDVNELKNSSNIMYKFNTLYNKKRKVPTLVLVPEELIAIFSDIMMGGKGDISYSGSLSEVQVNSSSEFMIEILKNTKECIFQRYQKVVDFDKQVQIVQKARDEFAENLDSGTYNLCIEYIFNVHKTKDFNVVVLMNEDITIETLTEMSLLSFVDEAKVSKTPLKNMDRINDVTVKLTAELGKTKIPIKKTLELGRGSIIELETMAGEDIKIYANEVEIAEAKIVAVDDHFGVQITKIITKEQREHV